MWNNSKEIVKHASPIGWMGLPFILMAHAPPEMLFIGYGTSMAICSATMDRKLMWNNSKKIAKHASPIGWMGLPFILMAHAPPGMLFTGYGISMEICSAT